MAKIVILGGGGFIGANLIKFLKEKGHYVRAVDKSFKPDRSVLYNYADEIIGADLREIKSCILALQGMDLAFHMAADMGGIGYFTDHEYTPFINNMSIDLNVFTAAELTKIQRVFYASSACAYPTTNQRKAGKPCRLSEDMLQHPAEADQMYGWEKLMITKLAGESPVDIRVGLQHTIFGEYQEVEGERMKFPTAIATKALKAQMDKKPIEIWGKGDQIRTFLYIEDAMEKIYEVLMHDNYYGPVNIGSEEEVSVNQIAKMCCKILGIKPNFVYALRKPSGVLARSCSNRKYNTYYQYRDQYTTEEGFRRLIKWLTNR